MEGIKKYGDLDDKELLEFLAEIKSGDEDIEEAEANADEKIDNEEAQFMLSELPENAEIEAYYGDDAWRKLTKDTTFLYGDEVQHKASLALVKANRQKAQRLKQDRIRIQRQAFNQEYIRLSDPIGNENIKLLVSLLVKEHTRMIDKYSALINKRLAMLLNPFIPRRLRLCKMLYPESIRICPGFLYKASKEYGGGLTFWAMPNIPYYFAQNTEQKILIERKPEFLISIDKFVTFYHEHNNKRTKKELKYASLIIQKGVYTYFDLLKLNPFWFEALYNNITEKLK